ncbi:Ester hydrolase [Trichostrongylus colubriformis]|uniref:Ester hydrolase n=1 Tax=Trichostrongylus colubriformis TaxID=6319 RepID=A0AAN8IAQ0_TRICO
MLLSYSHRNIKLSFKIASKVTIQQSAHTSPYKTFNIDSPKFNLMGNLVISEEAGPAEVVHVKCSERIGDENLPACIRKGLAQHYGQSCVSMAGVFLLLRGKADVHVVPDYPSSPFKSMKEVENWFHMFNVNAPLVCATVFHSYDPGYNLRMEHTHCYSDHNDGGHYHADTTPNDIEYEGWFTAAEKIYTVDHI